MRLSTMVVFILIGSTCFSVVFLGVNGGVWLEHHLTSIPGGVWGFLIFINLFIFFLAFFLDFFEIAFIILPMVAPIAQKVLAPVVGPDAALIWFGVMLCVNMQTSFLHPPFGFALFYLRGVAPKEVKSSDIYWGALPWIGLQAIMVAIVIAFPITVTALLDKPLDVDLSKVKIEVPEIELPPLDFGAPKAIAGAGQRHAGATERDDTPPLRANSLAVSTNFQLTTASPAGLVRGLHASPAGQAAAPSWAPSRLQMRIGEDYRCKRS